jgi:hypothetical protein
MNNETLMWLQFGLNLLFVPALGMMWSVQGRMSRMEGELKALYDLFHMILDRRNKND